MLYSSNTSDSSPNDQGDEVGVHHPNFSRVSAFLDRNLTLLSLIALLLMSPLMAKQSFIVKDLVQISDDSSQGKLTAHTLTIFETEMQTQTCGGSMATKLSW